MAPAASHQQSTATVLAASSTSARARRGSAGTLSDAMRRQRETPYYGHLSTWTGLPCDHRCRACNPR
jgi:hypothetical protein